ncbi:hypothetical protein [Chromobacterium paludis]|uniref:Uncharacterized protein n=1 Tax=Chromobacterium paludis TaxID=2605945 RepID=A0A5C1DK79_9NEIS|nr:hypothetical protein [Chromobacterium paludis]QEL57121.1 hypothetical protein FYK34_16940 [Chromobacterium paludis]
MKTMQLALLAAFALSTPAFATSAQPLNAAAVANIFASCDMAAIKKNTKIHGVVFNGVKVLHISRFDTPEENIKGLQLAVEVNGRQDNPSRLALAGISKQVGKPLKAGASTGTVKAPGYQLLDTAYDDGADGDYLRCLVKR